MLEVKNLTKDYGSRRAIDHLNFKVHKGEVVGFLGPNGAGKSTTMKIITGFMAPSSGEASVAGFDVFESPLEVKRRIGYLPETPPLYGDMLVGEYLNFVAELKKVPRDRRNSLVDSAIEKTNLGDVRRRLIQNLSKGFRQRVGIAQAIVSDPEVLILDEPTVGLDPKQVAEIRQLINGLRGQHTIILSTHILSEVQALCERIIIIHQGKIVAEDSIQNLAHVGTGHSRIQLRICKEIEDLRKILKFQQGLLKVESGPTRRDWIVEVENKDEIISQVASQVVENGLGLLEMNQVKLDLEDVFLKLTYGEKGV